MARLNIDIGDYPNDPDADQINEAFEKVNSMTSDLYQKDQELESAQNAGVIGYATKADMDADTTQPTDTVGLVLNDSNPQNNGYYRWNGSSWVKRSADYVDLREADFKNWPFLFNSGYEFSLNDTFPSTNIPWASGSYTYRDIFGMFKDIKLFGSDLSNYERITPSFLALNRSFNNNWDRLTIKGYNTTTSAWETVITMSNGYFHDSEIGGVQRYYITEVENEASNDIWGYADLDFDLFNVYGQQDIYFLFWSDFNGQGDDQDLNNEPGLILHNYNPTDVGDFQHLSGYKEAPFIKMSNPTVDFDRWSFRLHKAIRDIKIYGSDPTVPHKIWFFTVQDSTHDTRIIITRKVAGSWERIYDTGKLTDAEAGISLSEIKWLKLDPENNNHAIAEDIEIHIKVDWKTIDDRLPDSLRDTDTWPNDNPEVQDPVLIVNPNRIDKELPGSGGSIDSDSDLSVNSVQAATIKSTDPIPTGTLSAPPPGLVSGDQWADETDSSNHPIVRISKVST